MTTPDHIPAPQLPTAADKMARVTLRRPAEGNTWYPLPHDYDSLTEEGKRLARVASCCRRSCPSEFVESWTLFRNLYLATLPPGTFYKKGFIESPPAHYQWVEDFWTYPRNIEAAPRYTAKSVIIGTEIPVFLAATTPHCRIQLLLASDGLVEDRFEELMPLLEQTDALINDFGQLRSIRGQGSWNLHRLRLRNGSMIRGLSVESRKRGIHPHFLILDDPEFDPDKPGGETALSADLEAFLFHQVLPMLDETDRITWIGTLINRKAAIWRATMGDDSRFSFWNRRVYSLEQRDASGRATYFWAKRWDAAGCATLRKKLGQAAWEAECQNNPTSEGARILTLHDTLDFYEVSGNTITYHELSSEGTPTRQTTAYSAWLDTLARLFLVDAAHSELSTSDLSAIIALGIDPSRIWWVLAAWQGHLVGPRLAAQLYSMGLEWQPSLVGIESTALQDQIRQDQEAALEAATEGQAWQPRVWPITYPTKLTKGDRIAGVLTSRLSQHRIRFPRHLASTPAIRSLLSQIRDFTVDLALLPNDDLIDALAFAGYCPRPKLSELTHSIPETIEQQFIQGRTTDKETGLPLSHFIDPGTFDRRIVMQRRLNRHFHLREMAAARRRDDPQEKMSRFSCLLMDPGDILNRDH